VLAAAGPALAAWQLSGTGGGTAKASSLTAPTAPTATTVAPTSCAIDIAFAPSSNPPGTSYTVVRDKTRSGGAGPQVACSGLTASPCHDTGLASSTTFTYTVSAVLGTWSTAAATTPSATTAAPLAITSAGISGNKAAFSGTGSSGTTQITVVVCKANSFPCSSTNTEATVAVSNPSAGAWGPTAQTSNLPNGASHWAQATQGSSTSAVFAFAT
jgi:hypothetical protein